MTPRATYRLQLHAGFPFAAAAEAVPYLVELGVSHLYLSPVLQAAEGSTHGYDVVDPDSVSAQLGGEAGFRELVRVAKDAGLAILLDIVPNHMSIAGTGNRWWLDVLENGPASYYAHFFDVDWDQAESRVLLPVLGERYGRALTSRQIALGRFEVRVHDLRLPMSPRSIGVIVKRTGEVRAAVIDFGGFLGVGSRAIAVDWSALRFPTSGPMDHIILELTRDQVRLAPEYKPGEPLVVLGLGDVQPHPETPAPEH